MPFLYMTADIGRRLGSGIGKVEEVDLPESGIAGGKFLRVEVRIDLNCPLTPYVYLKRMEEGIKRIDVKYERLPIFCYECGLLGHDSKKCDQRSLSTEEGMSLRKFGAWLRAETNGNTYQKNDARRSAFSSSQEILSSRNNAVPSSSSATGNSNQVCNQSKVPLEGTRSSPSVTPIALPHVHEVTSLGSNVVTATAILLNRSLKIFRNIPFRLVCIMISESKIFGYLPWTPPYWFLVLCHIIICTSFFWNLVDRKFHLLSWLQCA